MMYTAIRGVDPMWVTSAGAQTQKQGITACNSSSVSCIATIEFSQTPTLVGYDAPEGPK